MGKVIKKIAPIALPIAGMMIPGLPIVAGAALGGFAGGMIGGQGLKGSLMSAAIAGGTAGVMSGGFSNPFAAGGMFGTKLAGTVPAGVNAAAGRAGMSGMIGAQTSTTAMGATSNIAKGMVARGATTASYGSMFGQLAKKPITVAPGVTTTGALDLGRDDMFRRTVEKQAALAASTAGGPTTSLQTPSLGATEGSSKILGFDKDKIEEMVGAGFSAYEGDIRQSQIDALEQNLGQYQSEYADYYAKEAKTQQEKLARGELPDTYTAALDREKDRLTRLMIAQGHNPAESGLGAENVVRGLMDLEQEFMGKERDYWSAIGGGADTMTSEIARLRMEQANQLRPRETTLGELGTSIAGNLMKNTAKSTAPTINLNLRQ